MIFPSLAPTYDSINPSTTDVDGGSVTISGTNFGEDPSSVTVTIDGSIACTVTDAEDTSILCNVGPGTGGPYDILIQVADQQVTASQAFSYTGVYSQLFLKSHHPTHIVSFAKIVLYSSHFWLNQL